MENVKNLVGKKNKPNFDKWLQYLNDLGYTSYWKVINAKDCGIPQNRERVFCLSFLDGREYSFPEESQMRTLADLGIVTPVFYESYFGERREYYDYCPTLTRATGGGHIPFSDGKQLSPYHCGLLMGLTPEESERLCASGLSKTRLYGCLGNSIVVDVLVRILEPIVEKKV